MSAGQGAGGGPGSGPDVFYEGRELEAAAGLDNYYAWIIDAFAPYLGGHAIEIGSGIGTFGALLRPRVDRLDLVEPSPNLTAVLHEKFSGDAGVTVHGATLEAHIAAMDDACRDAVVLVNVLEHIQDDREALAGLFRVTRPGGHLLLFVPALPFLFSELDRQFGHFRRYRRDDLGAKVADAGFEVRVARYFDILGVAPWWLLNTVGGKTDFNPRMVRLYDSVGVPVTRFAERLAAPPFGKNVLLVARRPD